MKKRVMAVLLTASMLVGLLAGCATSGSGGSDRGDSKSSEGKVTLKFLNKYPEDPYAQYFVDAVAQFEKENPDIDIEMENVSDEVFGRILAGFEKSEYTKTNIKKLLRKLSQE